MRLAMLPGLPLAVALTLTACGGSEGDMQDMGKRDDNTRAPLRTTTDTTGGEMSGMQMGEPTSEQGIGKAGRMDHRSYPAPDR